MIYEKFDFDLKNVACISKNMNVLRISNLDCTYVQNAVCKETQIYMNNLTEADTFCSNERTIHVAQAHEQHNTSHFLFVKQKRPIH